MKVGEQLRKRFRQNAIKWLEEAVLDLQNLLTYIKQDKPQAAANVAKCIYEAVTLLENQPAIGRPGRVPHTRELIIGVTPYIIPYRVKGEKIEVLRVLHASMPWPQASIELERHYSS